MGSVAHGNLRECTRTHDIAIQRVDRVSSRTRRWWAALVGCAGELQCYAAPFAAPAANRGWRRLGRGCDRRPARVRIPGRHPAARRAGPDRGDQHPARRHPAPRRSSRSAPRRPSNRCCRNRWPRSQAQAVLANAYHLYLQPGPDIVEQGGGLGAFMNWPGPTFTDSGGFQVLSLGAGFKKVLAMNVDGMQSDDVIAPGKNRLATVDDDGVTFKSHLDGSMHRFSPEISMRIQHQLGADIIFAFDECTTLMNTRLYQEQSVVRTQAWAERCIDEHRRLTAERAGRPYQALFAVVQGAQYEDLRRQATRDLVHRSGSTATASAGRWRNTTWAPSSGGSARNCRRTGRGTCWASANPTTCSPPSRTAPTPSTASRRRGSPGTARSTRPRAVQPDQRPVPHRLRPAGRRLRLLHLRALHPGLRASSVPREGDAVRDACPPSTTSGSWSGWSTGSGRASPTARSPTSARTSSAATTPRGARRYGRPVT